ncbi:HBL/NHE enterotoxin family protein [Aquimarina sp. 2201CG1-2-11]|uniref:HBL/NHE enterotoxin family protein n=1 Tax=Aquimarina discodermiae TaxID=3231043 RepID=UPI0034631074
MSIVNNPFSASGILLGAQNVMSSANLLQTYAMAVANQAEADIPEIPGFVTDQGTATRNAISIQTELIPSLVDLIAHPLAFSNLILAEYDSLVSDAEKIEDGSLSKEQRQVAVKDFIKGIDVLIQSIDQGNMQIKLTLNSIALFLDVLKKDNNSLDADLKMAEKLLKKDQIDKLQSALTAILGKLEADNEEISKGAVNGLVAAAQISLGVVLSYYKGPADGFKMIIAGIKGAAEEGSREQKALDDVNTQFDLYKTVITDLLSTEAIYGVVKTLTHMDGLLYSNVQSAQLSIEAFVQASQNFVEGLNLVKTSLTEKLSLRGGLQLQLDDAKSGWSNLHTQIMNFQIIEVNPTINTNEQSSVNYTT